MGFLNCPRIWVFAVFAMLAIGFAQPARAGIVTYQFNSYCLAYCDRIGLSQDEVINGSLGFDETSILPFGQLDETNIVSMSLDFGDVSVSLGSVQLFSFSGYLSSDTSHFASFYIFAYNAIYPNTGHGVHLNSNANYGQASTGATCVLNSLSYCYTTGPTSLIAPSTLTRTNPIPEPATTSLLVLGLLGIGSVAANRRHSCSTK